MTNVQAEVTSETPQFDAAASIPPTMRRAAAWAWRLLLVGLLVAAILWLISHLTDVLVPLAVALLAATLLSPVLNVLVTKLHFPRGIAVATCIVGLIALVAALLILAGRQMYMGFQDLADQAVAGINQVRDWLANGPLRIQDQQFNEYWNQIQNYFTTGDSITSLLSGAMGAAASVGSGMMSGLIALFCTIFFLYDGHAIWTWLCNLFPRSSRENVYQAGRRGIATLSAYVRTQILVAGIDSIGIGVGAAFFVPTLALPIGVLVFLGSFIPVVGAVVTGAIACVVVLVSHGWVSALIMLGIVLLVQQIESHVLQPFLMGHAVSLHPIAVLLSVSIGSMAAGIVGALFAVPVLAMLNTMVQYFFGHDKFPELGTEDHISLIRSPNEAAEISPTIAMVTDSLRRVREGISGDHHSSADNSSDSTVDATTEITSDASAGAASDLAPDLPPDKDSSPDNR
ncbi:MAG: AI-2E family transporter [Cellulomonadaceae bacterium]|jgi:predicted PurR-regulated permease PerM|nr:AI-2E family transporter [Cellulomonadaceae bacterium]